MIVKSGSPNVNIPDVSITDYVLRHAERLGDKPALIDAPTGRTLTYRQLAESVRRRGGGAQPAGIQEGRQRLRHLQPQPARVRRAWLFVALLGGINTTANPLYTADELAKQLVDSRARFLITVPPFLDKAKEAASKSAIEEIFVFGTAEGARPFAELLATGVEPPAVRIDPRGRPRRPPVLERHHRPAQGRDAHALQPGRESRPVRGQRLVARRGRRRHGRAAVLSHLRHGGHPDAGPARGATILRGVPRFDMRGVPGGRREVSRDLLPPWCLPSCSASPSIPRSPRPTSRASGSLFSGAAPLGADIARELSPTKLGCPVAAGLRHDGDEPVTHPSPPSERGPMQARLRRPASSRIPRCKIVDVLTGEEWTRAQEGELWIRGPQIMKGYLNQPEETAAVSRPRGLVSHRRRGIRGRRRLFLHRRPDQGAHQVQGPPGRARRARGAARHPPAALDAAVVRDADEEAGEVPKAFVVLKADEASRATTARPSWAGWRRASRPTSVSAKSSSSTRSRSRPPARFSVAS